MIRHILLITFKGEASPDDIAAVRAAFLAIPHQVSGVLAVEWGQDDSPEGRAEGFTHSVLMTFADEAARQRQVLPLGGIDLPCPASCQGLDTLLALADRLHRTLGETNLGATAALLAGTPPCPAPTVCSAPASNSTPRCLTSRRNCRRLPAFR